MVHTLYQMCVESKKKTSSTLQGFGLSFVGKCSWHFGPAKCCCWFSHHDNVQETVESWLFRMNKSILGLYLAGYMEDVCRLN